jgi:hypothetical protein
VVTAEKVDIDKVFEKAGVPASKGKSEEETKDVRKVEIKQPKTVLCKNEAEDDWNEVTDKKEKPSVTNDVYS